MGLAGSSLFIVALPEEGSDVARFSAFFQEKAERWLFSLFLTFDGVF